jgi:hypothetical protein
MTSSGSLWNGSGLWFQAQRRSCEKLWNCIAIGTCSSNGSACLLWASSTDFACRKAVRQNACTHAPKMLVQLL